MAHVAEVAVVGGGIAGASIAWELADRAEVVLLERERHAGTHSTGRSAAVLTETTGPPVVRRLAAASRAFLTDPPEGFCDTPLVSPRRVLWVADAATTARLDDLPTGDGIRRVDTTEAMALLPLLRPSAAAAAVVEDDGLEVDVDALLQGYLRGLRRRGGSVLVQAPVRSITRTAGGSWRMTAGDHDVDARVVVDAAGAWADDVARLAGVQPVGLRALKRTAFVFPPPEAVDVTGWPLVMDAGERFYLKPEAGLLLGSPADETPTDPCDARAEEVDVALAIDRIEGAVDIRVRTVRRAWAGLRTFAPDRAPVAGPDPDQPAFVWLGGQGGYGIKTAPALARLTASTVLGHPVDAELAAGVAPDRFR